MLVCAVEESLLFSPESVQCWQLNVGMEKRMLKTCCVERMVNVTVGTECLRLMTTLWLWPLMEENITRQNATSAQSILHPRIWRGTVAAEMAYGLRSFVRYKIYYSRFWAVRRCNETHALTSTGRHWKQLYVVWNLEHHISLFSVKILVLKNCSVVLEIHQEYIAWLCTTINKWNTTFNWRADNVNDISI